MNCRRCQSPRIASVNGKTADLCRVEAGGVMTDGHVPYGMGIGGGDTLRFAYCLDCGQLRGTFPVHGDNLAAPR